MAKYVKTDYVPNDAVPYLTVGVEYEVVAELYDGMAARINDDFGKQITILYDECAHIEDRDWTVINR